jgi:hypothetical protein
MLIVIVYFWSRIYGLAESIQLGWILWQMGASVSRDVASTVEHLSIPTAVFPSRSIFLSGNRSRRTGL